MDKRKRSNNTIVQSRGVRKPRMISLGNWARKIFRSTHERRIKKIQPYVNRINALEKEFAALNNNLLGKMTIIFRKRLANGESLDSILPEAFATVREAAKRVLGLRPFDVQLYGGIVLHERGIAEMRTGEGKTLMATLPIYLNALEGKGIHVITVNDYLAARDSETLKSLYNFLGLSIGVIVHEMEPDARRNAYACDITYGTNNEFGFDYLRDNMVFNQKQIVQRGHNYAIIDEVDSILIDEARTPLIISGPLEDRSIFYEKIDDFIPKLLPQDYEIDEKQRTAILTEIGTEKVEAMLASAGFLKGNSLYSIENITILHHINNALRAHHLFKKDKDYIIRNGEIIVIDEFTGRMMPGRRYSDGLHQALEAKEHVKIHSENQTLASITFQNYFRMYKKLAGMTGTATTEAEEFSSIYGLDVVEIPTNLPVCRIDEDDEIYRTDEEKYRAVVCDIRKALEKRQPILVGTTSIEKSEKLAERLRKEKIYNFQILNARYHEQEAYIIAQAGVPGSLTIATNMAGRGTDIQLGGNLEMRLKKELENISEEKERKKRIKAIRSDVAKLKAEALAAGGLYVLATERHESRRIDNQLRGRSGRQGDPGRSKFFLSLEDDLLRIFGINQMDGILQKLGLKEGQALVHPWINKMLEKAQKRIEARNFEIRKNLLKYDDVINDQRKVIFEQRMEIMQSERLDAIFQEMCEDVTCNLVKQYFPPNSYEKCNPKGLQDALKKLFDVDIPIIEWTHEGDVVNYEQILERVQNSLKQKINDRKERFGSEITEYFQKIILLEKIDSLWRDHLYDLEHLRSAVGFRGYAQRDPLNEYKNESFELFQAMLFKLRQDVSSKLMRFEITSERSSLLEKKFHKENLFFNSPIGENVCSLLNKDTKNNDDSLTRNGNKIGRNELCPCCSGKKYKHCHGSFV